MLNLFHPSIKDEAAQLFQSMQDRIERSFTTVVEENAGDVCNSEELLNALDWWSENGYQIETIGGYGRGCLKVTEDKINRNWSQDIRDTGASIRRQENLVFDPPVT